MGQNCPKDSLFLIPEGHILASNTLSFTVTIGCLVGMLSYINHWCLSCATENVDKFVRFFKFSIVWMVVDRNISWTGLALNAEWGIVCGLSGLICILSSELRYPGDEGWIKDLWGGRVRGDLRRDVSQPDRKWDWRAKRFLWKRNQPPSNGTTGKRLAAGQMGVKGQRIEEAKKRKDSGWKLEAFVLSSMLIWYSKD